jgi:hypothetical protein
VTTAMTLENFGGHSFTRGNTSWNGLGLVRLKVGEVGTCLRDVESAVYVSSDEPRFPVDLHAAEGVVVEPRF